jgi:DNA polymerase-3 subunit beta
MYVEIEKDNLETVVATAGKALATRSVLPVLEGVKLSATGNMLTADATNTVTHIAVSKAAKVTEMGAIVTNGKLLIDIVSSLPEGPVTIKTDNQGNVVITAGLSEITLATLPAKDFPSPPAVETGAEFSIPADVLKSMIKGTSLFAAPDQSAQEILTGVAMELEGTNLVMTAIDGYRIAQRCSVVTNTAGYNGTAIIPAKSLATLAKILPAGNGDVKISLGNKVIRFNTADGGIIFTAVLLNGKYIDYKGLIDEALEDRKSRMTLFTEDLRSAVGRDVTVAQAGNSTLLKLEVTNNYLLLNTSIDIAKVSDRIAVDCEGEDAKVGLNGKYLVDVLSVITDEQIILSFGSEAEPIMVQPTEGRNYLYYILPVRLNS